MGAGDGGSHHEHGLWHDDDDDGDDFKHRTRERCDDLAAQGFMVILPDYFRGVVPEECGPGDFACWAGALGLLFIS